MGSEVPVAQAGQGNPTGPKASHSWSRRRSVRTTAAGKHRGRLLMPRWRDRDSHGPPRTARWGHGEGRIDLEVVAPPRPLEHTGDAPICSSHDSKRGNAGRTPQVGQCARPVASVVPHQFQPAVRRRLLNPWPPHLWAAYRATMPSPPAAPATVTDPIALRVPLALTWNSSTIPFFPVWT